MNGWAGVNSSVHAGSKPKIVYLESWDSGSCEMCGAPITAETRRAHIFDTTTSKRQGREVLVIQVCAHCEMMNEATAEAEAESRRFTEVCVAVEGVGIGNYFGVRCLCGASTILRLNMCVRCWRESRMMSKAQSKINTIKKMTAEINRHIKEQKKWHSMK